MLTCVHCAHTHLFCAAAFLDDAGEGQLFSFIYCSFYSLFSSFLVWWSEHRNNNLQDFAFNCVHIYCNSTAFLNSLNSFITFNNTLQYLSRNLNKIITPDLRSFCPFNAEIVFSLESLVLGSSAEKKVGNAKADLHRRLQVWIVYAI